MMKGISESGAGAEVSARHEKMHQVREDVIDAVASKLGESPEDLKKAVASGKSLTELAAAKGVSKDELTQTVEAVVKKELPNASAEQISNITQRMVDGPKGHPHHGPPPPPPSEAPVSVPTSDGSTHVIA